MIVIEKNPGRKIPYEVVGTKIVFDDDLTINCAKRQGDEPVHDDICYDSRGQLVIGAAAGRQYVAEVDIPAMEYVLTNAEEGEDGEQLSPAPLDMDKVTLTLWAVE